MPIDETIESSLAPYRSDENCRLECLRSRVKETEESLWIDLHTKITPEINNLLVDLGYKQKEVKGDYMDTRANFYVREKENGSIDVLIEKRKEKEESTFTYFNVDKNELSSLEKSFKRSMKGEKLSGKGWLKRLAEPATLFSLIGAGCLASATIMPIATVAGLVAIISYANRTHDGKDSYTNGFLEYLSNKRIDKLNPEKGNSALLSALYLPGDNRNL